jgi:hypothetical protein
MTLIFVNPKHIREDFNQKSLHVCGAGLSLAAVGNKLI